jgi:hypothetical protein
LTHRARAPPPRKRALNPEGSNMLDFIGLIITAALMVLVVNT